MERLLKETLFTNNKGIPCKVITYGYDTEVDYLDVVMVIDSPCGDTYTLIHRGSGISLCIYLKSHTELIRLANKYFKGFDFTQNEYDLIRNGKLGKLVGEVIRSEML